jgi:hypothetical protein
MVGVMMLYTAAQIVLIMDGQEIAWFRNLTPSQVEAFRNQYHNDNNIVICLMPKKGNMPYFVSFLECCLNIPPDKPH